MIATKEIKQQLVRFGVLLFVLFILFWIFNVFYKREGHESVKPSISANGQIVAFETYDHPNTAIKTKDNKTGELRIVSTSSIGEEGNGESYSPAISDDGRFVAFISKASNLVPNDGDEVPDIFLKDTVTSTIQLVNTDPNHHISEDTWDENRPSVSGDGHYVVYGTSGEELSSIDDSDMYLKDTITGTLKGIGIGYNPDISASGQFVTFCAEPYVVNKQAELLDEKEGVQVFRKNLLTGEVASLTPVQKQREIDKYESDLPHIFGMPSISADGRYIAFQTTEKESSMDSFTTRNDVFVSDAVTGSLIYVGRGDQPSISPDGRFVVFHRWTESMTQPYEVNGVYLYDAQSRDTELVSCNSDCDPPDSYSEHPTISGDGVYVAFDSIDHTLLPDVIPGIVRGDYNRVGGIFLKDITNGEISRASRS